MRSYLIDALTPLVGADAAHVLAPTWFMMVALSAIAAAIVGVRMARRMGVDPAAVARAIVAGYAAAVAGGIIGPMLFDVASRVLAGRPPSVRWAGMTSWAGFAAGFGVMLWIARRNGVSRRAFLDCVALPCGLALAVARLGCFVAGCDYGQVSSSALAMRFPADSPAWWAQVRAGLVPPTSTQSLPVHPTQLYEVALGLALVAIAALCLRAGWHRRRPGSVFAAAAGAYALGRIGIEALRADMGRGVALGMSTGQWMSVAVLAILAVVALRSRAGARLAAAAAAIAVVLAAPAARADGPTFDLSGMLASSSPLNRPDEQVPALGGFTLSGTLLIDSGLGIGVDVSAMASDVAIHRSVMLSAELRAPISATIDLGLRGGIGLTNVDFEDDAFDTVVATGVQVGGTAQYWVSDTWAVVVWPLAFDAMGHRDLGGSIVSYQFRIGIAYGRRRAAAPASSTGAPPPPPPPRY